MRTFYIFWREYWSNITRRSYLAFTFGFPIFMISMPMIFGIILAAAISSATPPTDPRPVGMIDQPQLLGDTEMPNQPVEVIMYADQQVAAMALQQGDIQAYYHIQAPYWQSGEVVMGYDEPPTRDVDQMVSRWIKQAVRANAPEDVVTRLRYGADIVHHGVADSQPSYTELDLIEPILVYLVLYFVRLAGSFTASYMFDSIANEGRDRTLEILISTVSPLHFIAGKLTGLLAVGLTQIGMWFGAIFAFALVGSWLLEINLLGYFLAWEHLGLLIVVLTATYLMDQILAAGMGLLRVSGGAGNTLFATFNSVIGLSLLYAAYFVPRNPDAPLAVFASIFPLTSPLVLLIRVVVSSVPQWQITLSLLLLWGTNIAGILWLRRLLKANLVANSGTFSIKEWLSGKLKRWIPVRGKFLA